MKREKVNERLEEYIDKNCPNCYARITEYNDVHLDDRFKYDQLLEIMKILSKYDFKDAL